MQIWGINMAKSDRDFEIEQAASTLTQAAVIKKNKGLHKAAINFIKTKTENRTVSY